MLDYIVKFGSTSNILDIFVMDSTKTSTTQVGLTGLVFNTANLACYYHRNTAAAAVQGNLVTMTVGTFTSSGFKEIDPTNMPGAYQLCIPDAAFATGATMVKVALQGATGMASVDFTIRLTSFDLDSATVTVGTNSDKTGYSLSGTQTFNVTGNLSGSVGSVTGAVGSVTAGCTLTTGERTSVADALLTRDMSAVSPAPALNARVPLNALRFLRNAWTVAASTLTVYKEDDATAAWTSSITTNTAAQPITGSDPV